MSRQPHDRYFKALLSTPQAALTLARMALPSGALDGVSPADLQQQDTALAGGRRARRPDLLYRLRLPGGGRLMLLFEHQARQDRDMLLRLMDEALTLWRGVLRGRATNALPAVLPVVVYQGLAAWNAPTLLAQRFDAPTLANAALAPLLPAFAYGLLDLQRLDLAALPTLDSLRLGLQLLRAAPRRDPWPTFLTEAAAVRGVLSY